GVTFVSSDLAARRLQFLRDIATDLSRVGVIWNPDHVDPEYREAQTAARALGVEIHSLEVRKAEDFEEAFQNATKVEVQALMPITSRLMVNNRARIINFSNERRLLLVCGFGPWSREGALLSYGQDTNERSQRTAEYVYKILRHVKPDEHQIA